MSKLDGIFNEAVEELLNDVKQVADELAGGLPPLQRPLGRKEKENLYEGLTTEKLMELVQRFGDKIVSSFVVEQARRKAKWQ